MRKLMGAVMVLSAAGVHGAGAPVEERGPDFSSYPAQGAATTSNTRSQPAGPSNPMIELHYEVQELKEEVRILRGTVEEQAHELRQLRQRQMDDYQDLDRRLGGAGPAPTRPLDAAAQSPASGDNADSDYAAELQPATDDGAPTPQATASSQGEEEAYNETYNLLKARKIDEAAAGFKNLVAKYPSGRYAANSYYWLGEIHLLQNNLPEAEKAFAAVMTNFPAHRKSPDAMFKLGRVYHLQGQNDKAKELLGKVAAGNSNAASLARAYLDDNF